MSEEPEVQAETESAGEAVRQDLIDRGVLTPGEPVTAEENTSAEPPRRSYKSRKAKAVERATAHLQARINQLEAERTRPTEVEAAAAGPAKPRRADFQTDEEFEQAFSDFVIRAKVQTDAQAAERAEHERNIRNYAAQVQAAKAKYEDWDQLVNQEIVIGQAAQFAIIEQSNGAEIIYWLARNPDYARKLGQLRPTAAIAAVARLSDWLSGGAPGGGEQPEYRRPSAPRPRVPAPVRTVNTGGAGPSASFAEVAAKPNYPGKAADLKRILRDR